MKLLKFGFLGALIITSAMACEDDPDPVLNPVTEEKASLHLNINHKFNTDSFSLDQDFSLSGGEVVKFSTAQFYIGNFRLMDDEQNVTAFSDSYILATPSIKDMEIGEMEAMHYHMVMTNIGVDSATNVGFQPIDFADGHPLSAQLNNMWWSWNAGYIFFKLEGQIDRDADGTYDDVFEYHIGTNQNILNLQKMVHSNVAAGEKLELNLEVDYAQFFNGIDLNLELQGHMGPIGVVSKLKTNAALAFSLN